MIREIVCRSGAIRGFKSRNLHIRKRKMILLSVGVNLAYLLQEIGGNGGTRINIRLHIKHPAQTNCTGCRLELF